MPGSNCWPIFRWNLRSDYGAWVVRNVPTSTTSDLFVDILTSCNRSKVTCTCASSLFPLRTEATSYAGSTTKNIMDVVSALPSDNLRFGIRSNSRLGWFELRRHHGGGCLLRPIDCPRQSIPIAVKVTISTTVMLVLVHVGHGGARESA